MSIDRVEALRQRIIAIQSEIAQMKDNSAETRQLVRALQKRIDDSGLLAPTLVGRVAIIWLHVLVANVVIAVVALILVALIR